ncbi:MAG: glycosyltransferase, partial [Bacteroidota bacterium]
GNKNVSQSIGLYDLHFCYSHSVQRRIEGEFGIPTAFLPFGYELPEPTFEEVKDEPEIQSACFIGNPDEIRAAHLKYLAKNEIPVDVYGHGWERHLPNLPNIRLHEATYGKDFWRKMRAYRLQINIFRPHNEGSHNMRTFEIPAVGGIMLSPDSPEHRAFFEPEKEVFLYQTMKEMATKAKQILALPEAEAAEIRRQARKRSVVSGYSYERRAGQVQEVFEQLQTGNDKLRKPLSKAVHF